MTKGILKRIALAMLASTTLINAYAVAPGFYMGLMIGPATNDGKTQLIHTTTPPKPGFVVPANPRSGQFGTHIVIGNQLNKYVAFEGGLTLYSNIHYVAKTPSGSPGATARVRTFDVMVKGIFPFGQYFDVFGKAGVAPTYVTTSGALNGNGKGLYQTKVSPIISIGGSYTLNQNWVLDLSWTRTMVGSVVGNVDFYALGASYHFVDRYCGQFLCDD